jgi:hypothetical protein
MTMTRARSVARLAMITTNRKISRCSVVIDGDSVEESFAMRPLGYHGYGVRHDGNRHVQDGVVADLEDEAEAGSIDAKCPLKSNVLCLRDSIRKREHM